MSARSVAARQSEEGQAIARRLQPSAREAFLVLNARRLASRPVIGEVDGEPVYGKPTFRNHLQQIRDELDNPVLDARGQIQWELV